VVPSDDGRWLLTASSDQVKVDLRMTCEMNAHEGEDAPSQTARVWDAATGETKTELRGHDHVVETAEFAPVNSYAAIRELTGFTVGLARARRPLQFWRIAESLRDRTGAGRR
jgi:platelet-activating factor acetylhydrolase IB subunit alpha